MTDITHQTKPSSEYLALPPEERELLRKHFSRLGRKGGKSVPHDKRVRAGKLGANARMRTLATRLHEEEKSKTDIVDNC